jgi:V/A-type H+-transporting ATPase subunit K
MVRFCTRLSLVFRLGIVLACVAWFTAVFRYSPAVAAEPPVAKAVSSETQAETSPAVSWQSVVKMFAAALTICVTAFATAHTQRHIGTAGVGALAENPKLFGNILIYLVVPETMVILGFVIAALILL